MILLLYNVLIDLRFRHRHRRLLPIFIFHFVFATEIMITLFN